MNLFLDGVNELADILVKNSQAVIAATPADDPQLAVRRANLERIERARAKIHAVRSFPPPTVHNCAARRDAAEAASR